MEVVGREFCFLEGQKGIGGQEFFDRCNNVFVSDGFRTVVFSGIS